MNVKLLQSELEKCDFELSFHLDDYTQVSRQTHEQLEIKARSYMVCIGGTMYIMATPKYGYIAILGGQCVLWLQKCIMDIYVYWGCNVY